MLCEQSLFGNASDLWGDVTAGRRETKGGGREVRAGQEKAVGLAFPPGGTSQGQFEPLNVKVATLWAQRRVGSRGGGELE